MDYRIVSEVNPNSGRTEYNIQYKQYGIWKDLNGTSDIVVQEPVSFKIANEAEGFLNTHDIFVSDSNINEETKNEKNNSHEFEEFLIAYDNINIESLSNDELQSFKALCDNGVIDAQREERKRGL